MTRRSDLHSLAAPYALDALDGSERDAFERHLLRCTACADEVRSLTETTAALAMAAAAPPPAGMRARVLAAAADTRQLPPIVAQREAPAARHSRRVPRLTVPRLAIGVASASLVAAGVLGGVAISTSDSLHTAQTQSQAIAAVLAAPDARIASQPTTSGGTATVVVSHSEGKIVFSTARLPALPASKVYELWLLGPTAARRAGLLPAPSGGTTAPVLASGLLTGDKVGVTVEPAGGTDQPTTTPILVMALPA